MQLVEDVPSAVVVDQAEDLVEEAAGGEGVDLGKEAVVGDMVSVLNQGVLLHLNLLVAEELLPARL